MQRDFWSEKWRAGQIGFHQAAVNPHLVKHGAAFLPGGTTTARVLVPLCGKTHDLAWLRQRGHEVWGVEFVEEGARAFFTERGARPDELRVGPHLALATGGVTIVVADIFALQTDDMGRFDALYDRAALVAIEPARRRAYFETLRRLATPAAKLLLISFDHDMPPGGPPFSVPAAELAQLGQGLFALEPLGEVDTLQGEPRFRDRGATRMRETIWLGTAE